MVARTQRRQRTEIRRAEIADAAGSVMVRRGSEHITIKEIAREISLSEGAIYRHFRNKRDILSLMVEHAEDSLLNDIDRSFKPGRTPLQILETALQKHVSSIRQRQGVSFQVIAEVVSLGDKKLNEQASEALDAYTSRIRGLLSSGIKAGEVRKEVDPKAAALLVASMIQGLVNSWFLSNRDFNLEERYEVLWDILRKALATEDAKPRGTRDGPP
ncbi:MAG: TetR/AcrR family transcriptional regulator [Dehalococcoidia bacterium]|nr:TetR/AcrR family transcriptional regulator [Dehalococcoidia bacterium]